MLEILKFILILSIGLIGVKFCLSFVIGFFTFTLGDFMSIGSLMVILVILRIVETDTAWTIVEWAAGLGLVCDVLKFFRSPGEVFSSIKEIFNSPIESGSSSPSSYSDDRQRDEYGYSCCGNCFWKTDSASYGYCQSERRDVANNDRCSNWRPS